MAILTTTNKIHKENKGKKTKTFSGNFFNPVLNKQNETAQAMVKPTKTILQVVFGENIFLKDNVDPRSDCTFCAV